MHTVFDLLYRLYTHNYPFELNNAFVNEPELELAPLISQEKPDEVAQCMFPNELTFSTGLCSG